MCRVQYLTAMCKSLSEALSVSLVIAGHMTTKEIWVEKIQSQINKLNNRYYLEMQ